MVLPNLTRCDSGTELEDSQQFLESRTSLRVRSPAAQLEAQDVEDLAVLIDGSPEMELLPLDLHEQLILVPSVAQPALSTSDRLRRKLQKDGCLPIGSFAIGILLEQKCVKMEAVQNLEM